LEFLWCLVFGAWCFSASAATLEISLRPTFAGAPLALNEPRYENSAGEKISVSRVSFLASSFALERADGSWLEFTNEFAWFDAEKNRLSHALPSAPPGEYRSVRFFIGLDEFTNTNNLAQHAADHALNPNLNSLHWSWQGGYIFLAVEGMWQANGAAQTGFSYHFARSPNRTRISLNAALDLTHDASLHLDFDLATLLNAPRPLSFARDGDATHSRTNDPIAAKLAANLPGAFRVRKIETAASATTPAATLRPLYLPEKFTPFPFQMSAFFPIPDLPRDNPLLTERVTLGEKLFHEKLLSKDNTLACASCHKTENAFADPRKYSVGVREQTGTRNAMPLFNLAWKNSFFWDGRAPSLRAQALMPIQDHTEMDETLTNVIAKLLNLRSRGRQSAPSHPTDGLRRLTSAATNEIDYPALFAAAFGSPDITPEKISLAIESFVLSLTSFGSKFDRALLGQAEFTEQEKRGFELFMTEYEPRTGNIGADCFHCHGGPLFTDNQFHNNGLNLVDADLGRFKVTGKDYDKGKFSTPSLRNVALTAPYMHDGKFKTLDDVIAHYDHGLVRSPTLDPNLAKHPPEGLRLSREDQDALVAFLKTLTDEKYLAPAKP
jgi:cytochrome c peroxidase